MTPDLTVHPWKPGLTVAEAKAAWEAGTAFQVVGSYWARFGTGIDIETARKLGVKSVRVATGPSLRDASEVVTL